MKKKKLKKRIKRLEKESQTIRSQFGTIKNSVREIRNMVDIVKQRTETDYTQFKPLVDTSKGPDTVSKTCDTCLYNGMGLDGPCMGCTAEDLKMYKQKENLNEQ